MRSFPLAVYMLILLGFVLLAGLADARTLPYDQPLFDAIHNLRSSIFDPPMQAVSFLGETVPSIIIAGPFVIWLWVKGFRREAVGFVVALVAVSLAAGGIKYLIDRTRPNGEEFSFVSGHSSYFTVFSGYLVFALKKVIDDRRWLAAWRIGLVTLIVLTGFSRVYLGVHWPSDVLGGFLVGVLVLMPVVWRVDNPVRVAT